ncbi:YciI family protein [Streptomyces sp. MS1.AVA.1]|uniref:YciI family protein n=1 Tax=Streptomyces machairae TaxID=3134109 RepID=A0ABU8UT13_9ACTN
MFVLELTYTAPIEAVDAVLEAHVAWLDEQYARGHFLASGRKTPRRRGDPGRRGDRARIEEIASTDPFVAAGVCAYRITEFYATKTAPELERYRETPD